MSRPMHLPLGESASQPVERGGRAAGVVGMAALVGRGAAAALPWARASHVATQRLCWRMER